MFSSRPFVYYVLMIAPALAGASGCRAPAETIHPKFATLRPETVRIEVTNESLRTDLRHYRVEAPLQVLIAGSQAVDVLSELRQAAGDVMDRRGYRVLDDEDGVEAELRVRIRSWNDGETLGTSEIAMGCEVELVRTDSQVSLYKSRRTHRIESRGSALHKLTRVELKKGILQAMTAALEDLPP